MRERSCRPIKASNRTANVAGRRCDDVLAAEIDQYHNGVICRLV